MLPGEPIRAGLSCASANGRSGWPGLGERRREPSQRSSDGCWAVSMAEKPILCVGLVCLDIISLVDRYPEEDTDTRCLSQRWQRGGNASNTCTVLSLLGAPCAFMGSLAPGNAAE
ncbi:hypothetical protein lerEdw1_015302 [Lerista edwardsae]|nr:hypothetical protein lerEdw1_015302 [Lerista edwardsae]